MKSRYVIVSALAASLIGFQAWGKDWSGEAKDAWIAGKLEAVFALNRHLNPFTIDTAVDNGVVHLTGSVESDIDHDLAGELAKGIDGVVEVDNDLQIDAQSSAARQASTDSSAKKESFGAWVDDATTSAAVKSKLIANPNTKALKIHVDTRGDVVTLSGQVSSSEESKLAEEIARNTGDVKDVDNKLMVRGS